MGQKINPIALRIQSHTRDFDSNWYSNFFYTTLLVKDLSLQRYLDNFLRLVKYPQGRYGIRHLPKNTKIAFFFCDPSKSRQKDEKFYGIHGKAHTRWSNKSRRDQLQQSSPLMYQRDTLQQVYKKSKYIPWSAQKAWMFDFLQAKDKKTAGSPVILEKVFSHLPIFQKQIDTQPHFFKKSTPLFLQHSSIEKRAAPKNTHVGLFSSHLLHDKTHHRSFWAQLYHYKHFLAREKHTFFSARKQDQQNTHLFNTFHFPVVVFLRFFFVLVLKYLLFLSFLFSRKNMFFFQKQKIEKDFKLSQMSRLSVDFFSTQQEGHIQTDFWKWKMKKKERKKFFLNVDTFWKSGDALSFFKDVTPYSHTHFLS